jgi:hypothetical protein
VPPAWEASLNLVVVPLWVVSCCSPVTLRHESLLFFFFTWPNQSPALTHMGACDLSIGIVGSFAVSYGGVEGGWRRGRRLKNVKLLKTLRECIISSKIIIIIINLTWNQLPPGTGTRHWNQPTFCLHVSKFVAHSAALNLLGHRARDHGLPGVGFGHCTKCCMKWCGMKIGLRCLHTSHISYVVKVHQLLFWSG